MNTKVLLVSDTVYDANGVSRFIQDMAAQSRRKGDSFSVLSSSPLGPETPEKNIVNLPPFWYVRMPFYKEQYLTVIPPWRRMYRFVKTNRPDIIHISTPGPMGLCAMAIAKRFSIPVAGTYHTDFPSYIRKQMDLRFTESVTRGFMRFFFRRMRKVFSRSRLYMEFLERDLMMGQSRLEFIPPGTDIARFSPAHKNTTIWRQFDIPSESVKILYVGRLSIEKNFMFVIDLFERLQAGCDIPLSLIVVGEGALAEDVSRRRNSHIHLLGLQRGETLSQLYASSDLMLFASVTETLGQVVMEAQASGLPCIVSDRGGVTDIVESGRTGYCISVDDETQWYSKSMGLIRDEKLRKRIGDEATNRMQNRSIEKTYSRFMAAHEEIVKNSL